MSTLAISLALREAITEELQSAIGNNGTIKLYTSPKADTVDDIVPANATRLATITLPADTFPDGIDEEDGTLTTGEISDVVVDNSGEATWARLASSTGTAIMDMNVTASEVESGDLGTITISDNVLVSGQTLSVDPITFDIELSYSS